MTKNIASMHSTWRLCLSWCFAKVFIAVKNLPFQPLYEKRFGMASMLTPALDFIVFPQMQHE